MFIKPSDAQRARVCEIIEKGLTGAGLAEDEILELFKLDPESPLTSYLMWAGRQLQFELCNGKAEVHAQVGLNSSTCPHNCKFCSFAACNDVREKGKYEVPVEEVLEDVKIFIEDGANLILLLATGTYPKQKAAEMVQTVREIIDPDMPLLINFDDMSAEDVRLYHEAGANGAYHAVRMREGIDTKIPVERRFETIHNLVNEGMTISTCVEPVGPEHTPEELTEATLRCLSYPSVSAGIGKRITVPGTLMEPRGELNDFISAKNVAIYRLAAGKKPILNCSASTPLTAAAGANLNWAEMGSNPRDTVKKTEDGGHGSNVAYQQRILKAAGYEILDGYSKGWIL
ncbi:MAG: hypothetical protein Q3982_02355 [Phoenicibacter congonensis]|uniref:Radical SAM core domain-containing protein n=1 Tax=Phoenicibacter congonensis TaxID=1944646 RepID=A0AA43RGP2_9ACTN|nr:hypothetical protein [Phoenicibacter congonensis]